MRNLLRVVAVSLVVPVVLAYLTACSGKQSFSDTARAGDTVALIVGWKKTLARNAIVVNIKPASGSPVWLPPGDPAIRSVVNLYADPVSRMVVGTETEQELGTGAYTYGSAVQGAVTDGDNDWYVTAVFLDLPPTLSTGPANIEIFTAQGEEVKEVTVDIVGTGGSPHTFETWELGPLQDAMIHSLERTEHNTVVFVGSAAPYSVQLSLTHDPDASLGGAGKAYAVNPRGDIKNLTWRDDGQKMNVQLTPTRGSAFDNLKDLKFYTAGGITGVQLEAGSLKAFDIDGNPITGINKIATAVLPVPAPTISLVSTATASVGQYIQVQGNNLCHAQCGTTASAETVVSMGAYTDTVPVYVGKTDLVFQVPAGAKSGPVTVSNLGGKAASSQTVTIN